MFTRWTNPFRDIQTLQNQMNRRFSETFGPITHGVGEEGVGAVWAPPVDISETPEHLTFSVEVPGFRQEDLNVRVENGILTIEGERKFEEEKKEKNWHRVERSYGKFFRSFSLPANVDPANVRASLEEGVLLIDLAKKEEAKPKSIPIGTGGPKQIGPGKKAA